MPKLWLSVGEISDLKWCFSIIQQKGLHIYSFGAFFPCVLDKLFTKLSSFLRNLPWPEEFLIAPLLLLLSIVILIIIDVICNTNLELKLCTNKANIFIGRRSMTL